MSLPYWSSYLFIIASIILILDILAVLVYVRWYYKKKLEHQLLEEEDDVQEQLISIDPDVYPLKEIKYSSSESFTIPGQTITDHYGNKEGLNFITPSTKSLYDYGEIDVNNYERQKTKSKKSPKLYFNIFYDFQTSNMQVTLRYGKYLPEFENKILSVSIMMSHCVAVHKTMGVVGTHPIFNETTSFILDSIQISSTPPIMLKLNLWVIDRFSRKSPYGFIEVSIAEILAEQARNPGDKPVCRDITKSEILTDESQQGDVLISLSYLRSAQRISIVLIKAKDLVVSPTDREIQGTITLLYRDVEQKVYYTDFVEMSSYAEFNREFVFNLADYKIKSIDDIAINFELQSRQRKYIKPRSLGKVLISSTANRNGQQHFGEMITSNTSVSKWHALKPFA